MRAGGSMVITLPCPEAWKAIPLYDLAHTFSRINPHAPPAKIERINDGDGLRITLLSTGKHR